MTKIASLVCGLLLAGALATAHAEELKFPYRTKYKHVPIMEVDRLARELGALVVVDVRSRYEYETLHIRGAVHIPLNKEKLVPAVRELRQRTGNKPIVFYCNGTTCQKSYKAADLALSAGIAGVFAYDAGLDLWSTRYPEHSVLLGRSPVRSADLIDKSQFKKRLLSAAEFEARVEQGAMVLDIRDLRQRDVALFPFKEARAQLDETHKIAEVVAQAKRNNKPLLVYDKVGKQTRWFQYYLEREGLKDNYFMDGGAEGYHEAKFGKLDFQLPDQS